MLDGDGIANPDNVHSRDYLDLDLALGWMEFHLRGVHTVADGAAVVPEEPGGGRWHPRPDTGSSYLGAGLNPVSGPCVVSRFTW
ncbi:hypothetical protein [Streptomyces hokutonensis]|uniref:hypothetical protein n=1 Tax=Streptomyces hokutonensis TaxID=1306990 RepID=UPI003673CD40